MDQFDATLLIPCRNGSSYLPSLFDGIRKQSPQFREIIVCDDASTDNSAEIAASLGATVLRNEQQLGVSRVRNRLAQEAQSEWIKFHDADDLIDPAYLREISSLCSQHTDVVTCDADWLDADTRQCIISWRYDAEGLTHNPATVLLETGMSFNNSMIRRSIWNAVGGCNEKLRMWEDADLHLRLALNGAIWVHHSNVLTRALRRKTSLSHNYQENWQARLLALEGYLHDENFKTIRPQLAGELEKAAYELLRWGDPKSAAKAVRFCKSLSHPVPSSHHFAVKLLRPLIPALWLLKGQQIWRDRALKK